MLVAACGGNRLSVGSNEGSGAGSGLCGDGIVTHDVRANRQAQIDELRGCEVIDGTLHIARLPGTDEEMSLAALSSLRRVRDSLELEGLPSLAGLEALEQVGNLKLVSVEDTDLTVFGSLERVVWDPPGSDDGGVITISGCQDLHSLAGLERLTTWNRLLVLENPALETLSGLSGPARLVELKLRALPALRDLRGLEFARQVGSVELRQTGVESLSGISLESADTLRLIQNGALVSFDGLERLASVDNLQVDDNASLLTVRLPSLEQVQSISITRNGVLQSVPGYRAIAGRSLGYRLSEADFDIATPNGDLYEVGGNPQVTEIVLPSGYSDVQQVSIWGNSALIGLAMSLRYAGGLQIRDNPVLRGFRGDLERVGDLEVVNNPALPTWIFAAVKTFSTTMSGNLDAPAP
jgi:hypothetical protein